MTCRGQFVTGTRAPSGAKARVIIGSDGTAEAVPLPKANKPIARSSLRGLTLALGFFQLKAGDSFKLAFRGTQGQTPFDIMFQIGSAIRSDAHPDSTIAETTLTNGLIEPGWAFVPNEIDADIIVNSPGTYEVFLAGQDREWYLGLVTLAHLATRPYSPEEITALKSDPLATKFVRIILKYFSVPFNSVETWSGAAKSHAQEYIPT